LEEIRSSGCHWAVGYPKKRRPTGVRDGALIFIGRLTKDPHDTRIFGRGIGMSYVEGRDDATAKDIALRDWKNTWPRYIRVHDAELLRGTLANGVSLNELMGSLGSSCFAVTKRHAARREGNTNPRRAYLQQPAVKLSAEGREWITGKLEAAFERHGKLSRTDMADLDWPAVPRLESGKWK